MDIEAVRDQTIPIPVNDAMDVWRGVRNQSTYKVKRVIWRHVAMGGEKQYRSITRSVSGVALCNMVVMNVSEAAVFTQKPAASSVSIRSAVCCLNE